MPASNGALEKSQAQLCNPGFLTKVFQFRFLAGSFRITKCE